MKKIWNNNGKKILVPKEQREPILQRVKLIGRKRSFRIGTYTVSVTVVVLIIAAIVNLCVNALPTKYTRLDMTGADLFSISKQTEELVQSLSQEITIYYIAQDGSEDAAIEQLLNRYKELNSTIKVEQVDPVERPTFASQYTSAEIYNNSLIVVSGEKSRYISYYDIYPTSYQYDETAGYYEETSYNGEGALTSAINYVTSDETAIAYLLEGHGEKSLPTVFAEAIEQENITTKSLNLITEGEIPKDCQTLIIFGPTADISSKEKKILSSYLESGGNLLLMTDCLNQRLENLYDLMEDYGVELVDGMLVEGNENYFAQGYANYLVPQLESHEITDPLIEANYFVMMPIAQGLEIKADAEEEEDLQITPLLMTTEEAFSKIEGLEASNAEKAQNDITTEEGFAVGAAITKTQDNDDTQIVWFTSTYIAEEQVDALVSGGNINLLTNAMGWLCELEDSISIHAKAITTNYLTLTAAQTGRWSLILVGIIPSIFLISGFVVWWRRRKR